MMAMMIYSSLVASLLLVAALFRTFDEPDPISVALVLASLAVALAGCCSRRPARKECSPAIFVPAILGLLLVAEFYWLCRMPPSVLLPQQTFPVLFHDGMTEAQALVREQLQNVLPLELFLLIVLFLGMLVASYAWRHPVLARWRFPAIMAAYFALGVWVIRSSPAPPIDVWQFQQQACKLLLHGKNPYAAEYSHPYPNTSLYGREMVKNNLVQSFPYPPLSLLLVLPGYVLAGDVRWSLLLALLGIAAFMVATGRRLGLPAGHPAELAAVALLCQPRGLHVVEMAWTEPLLVLAFAISLWALAGGHRRMVSSALAAAIAAKQFGILCLPSVWASRRLGWRPLAAAVVLALAIAMPFIGWNPAAFWRGNVAFHMGSPFRTDSISVPAALAMLTGYRLSPVWGFVAAAGAACLILWRGAPTLATAPLGSAAIFLAFVVFGKAGNLNYYWLTEALLLLALITSIAEANQKSATADQPRR